MNWQSIEGLSALIRNANWGIAGSVLLTFIFTVAVIVADKKREKLLNAEELKRASEIAELNKEAGEARKSAGDAIERAAKLERDAAELNRKTEEEHLARVKIEERLAPRIVSTAQAAKLISDLSALKGRAVTIQFITGSPEIVRFVDSLEKPLTQAGLSVTKAPVMILGNVEPGITLQIGTNRIAEAEILANALANAELAMRPVQAQELKDPAQVNILIILVGPK